MFLLISGLISLCGCIALTLFCFLSHSKAPANGAEWTVVSWFRDPQAVFGDASYYIILAVVVFWVAQLIVYLRSCAFSPKDFLKRHWPELTFALLATIVCFISVQCEFRVMSDEANLLSVSENLLIRKKALNIVQAEHYYGNLQIIQEMPDKRPLLFPFLVCLVHLVRGFNPSNSFVANGLLLFFLLAGAAVTVQRLVGRLAAFSTVIMLASYPLICLCATSGGFDLIAAFFLCTSLLALAIFMREPSAETFAFLWITLLTFAHTRYESFLAFPIVFTCVAAFGYLRREYFTRYTYLYVLTPWLVLPLAFQRFLTMSGVKEGYEGSQFGLEHFQKNADEALKTLKNFSYELPYPTLLNIIAAICLVWLALALILGRITIKDLWQRHFLATAVLLSTGFLILFLAYFFGRVAHPSSARIFVFYAIVAALIPVVFRHNFPSLLGDYTLLGMACVSAILYHSISIEDRFANTQHLIREIDAERDFLDRNQIEYDFLDRINDKRFLIICDRPVDFTSLGYGAMDFATADAHYREYMSKLNAHLFLGYIVFQRIEYNTQLPVLGDRLGNQWGLSVKEQLQIRGSDPDSPGEYLRISVVTPAD